MASGGFLLQCLNFIIVVALKSGIKLEIKYSRKIILVDGLSLVDTKYIWERKH